jgi:hypothetical protein
LRFIRVLLLERRDAPGDADEERAQNAWAKEYCEFLQLNVPPTECPNTPLMRQLHRHFPLDLRVNPDEIPPLEPQPILTELVDYAVGEWRCKCGALSGKTCRFDYSCTCGLLAGTGSTIGPLLECVTCGTAPSYYGCPTCHTRVSLDLVWRIESGNVHPSELTVRVVGTLSVNDGSRATLHQVTLLRLPLMLGLRDDGNQITFDHPGLLWRPERLQSRDLETEACLVGLCNTISYDRRTSLAKVMEALVRRTFGDWKRASLRRAISLIAIDGRVREGRTALEVGVMRRFFDSRNAIVDSDARSIELVRSMNTSIECLVGHSGELTSDMAYVSEGLAEQLSGPFVANYVRVVTTSKLGDPQIGRTEEAHHGRLGTDGVVSVGALVQPGNALVGVSVPNLSEETAEAELLRAIVGEP